MELADVLVTAPRDAVALVELKGEHDYATSSELGSLLESLVDENELVVVDVSHALFIDSSVITNLLQASRASSSRAHRFRLHIGTAPLVGRVLEISGALQLIEHTTTREAALA
jgi:anti-anti-sigma factor